MAWVRLDDKFPDHPKIERAGERAAWLFVCGLCYCAEHLTDGHIPESKAHRLTDGAKTRAAKLVEVGLWVKVDDGYLIPGYLEYQPSAEKVKAERSAAADRMRTRRDRSAEVPTNTTGTSASPYPSPSLVDSSQSSGTPVGDDLTTILRPVAEREAQRYPDITDLDAWVTKRAKTLAAKCRRSDDPLGAAQALLEPVEAVKPHPLDDAQRAQYEAAEGGLEHVRAIYENPEIPASRADREARNAERRAQRETA